MLDTVSCKLVSSEQGSKSDSYLQSTSFCKYSVMKQTKVKQTYHPLKFCRTRACKFVRLNNLAKVYERSGTIFSTVD